MTSLSAQIDADHRAMRMRMWDLGPKEPERPEKPVAPKAKEGTPDYELQMLDFRAALTGYEKAFARYAERLRDFEAWEEKFGGPYEIDMNSVDAREALQRDRDRYRPSDPKLKNQGLPIGRKPGPWHFEELRRREAERVDFQAARERDPVFGEFYREQNMRQAS